MHKLVKALGFAFIAWIVLFFIATAVWMVNQTLVDLSMVSMVWIVVGIVSWSYLKGTAKERLVKESSILMIVMLVLSLILDTVFLVYGFAAGWQYFMNPNTWAGYVEVIIVPLIVAFLLKRK